MEETKQSWGDYSERLKAWKYTDEQLEPIKEMREKMDHCSFDQFKELVRLGIVVRTQKLRKPRNLFTDGVKFYYTNHYFMKINVCGYFKNEENE